MDPTASESKEQRPVFEEPSEDASQPARQQRFEQWAQQSHDTLQGSFDTLKFCQDFLAKDVIATLTGGEVRLLEMVGDYPQTERGAANRNQLGMSEEEFVQFCSRAMRKFCNFDFAKLHEVEIGVLRNAFQASDPARFPETDPMLQMSFDVLGCVDSVVEMIATGQIGPPPKIDQAVMMAILQQALGGGGGELDLSALLQQLTVAGGAGGEGKEGADAGAEGEADQGRVEEVKDQEDEQQPSGEKPSEEGA